MSATVITTEKIAALRQAIADYDGAILGQLNKTADDLRDACRAVGWTWAVGGGARAWAIEFLRTHGG